MHTQHHRRPVVDRLFHAFPVAILAVAAALSSWLRSPSRGIDWGNYLWATRHALAGHNPYALWARDVAHHAVTPTAGRADLLPLQLGLDMALVALGGPLLLALTFVLAHALCAMVLHAIGEARHRRTLVWLAWFWAGCPLVVLSYVDTLSNKTIAALLLVLLVLTMQRLAGTGTPLHPRPWAGADGRRWLGALTLATLLGNYTWAGFVVLPLCFLLAPRRLRTWVAGLAVVGGVTLLSHLPFAPSWLVVYQFRLPRVAAAAGATSPLRLISEPLRALTGHQWPLQGPGTALLLVAVYVTAWRYRAAVPQCAVLAVCALALWRTDADVPTILLCTMLALVACTGALPSWVDAVLPLLLLAAGLVVLTPALPTLPGVAAATAPVLLALGLLVHDIGRLRARSCRLTADVARVTVSMHSPSALTKVL